MNRLRTWALILAVLLPFGVWAAPDPPPLNRVDIKDLAVTGAANIVTHSHMVNKRCVLRIAVAIQAGSTDSVFSVAEIETNTSTQVFAFNGGVALVAGNAYTFTWAGDPDTVYNYRLETSTRLGRLVVDEIQGGVD